jgi:glycosyltransferase involved in cell wall biosynthesis
MIVTDQYEPMVGGVPTVTRELARGLTERGHAVTLVAPSASGHGQTASRAGALTEAFRGSVRWPWYEGQRLGLLSPAAARRLIDGFAPDVVHLHSPLTLGATARSAARRRGVPVLYTNHYLPANVWPGLADPGAAGKPARSARSAGTLASATLEVAFYAFITGFANHCDHVTAPTATALQLLREHGLRAPSQVVSNGIDLDTFAPGTVGLDAGALGAGVPSGADAEAALRARYGLPRGRPVILSVGRLSPEKRADVLIEAAAQLADPGALLVLAGPGPDEDRLRALAASRGAADRVRFLGFVPGADLPGLYRLADMFAIASPAELQSLVTMEAMASGLPVVAVQAGALGELVHAGENGFLARPGRAADIAGSLDLLCADPALRSRMSKASRRIIADHDRRRLLSRWESIYRVLAARDPDPADSAASAVAEKNRQR